MDHSNTVQSILYTAPFHKKGSSLHDQDYLLGNLSSAYQYPTIKKIAAYSPETQIKKQDYIKEYSTFKFEAFDITKLQSQPSLSKQEHFMGAFTQTQFQFKCFDLNVQVPSMSEFVPFSRILNEGSFQNGQESLNDLLFEGQTQKSEDLKIKEIKSEHEEKEQIHDISEIEEIKQNEGISFFENYNEFLFSVRSQNNQRIMWDQNEELKISHVYQLHHSRDSQFIAEFEDLKEIYLEQPVLLTSAQICRKITEMFQNTENELFSLDYSTLQWSFDQTSIRIGHLLKYSLKFKIKELLQLANKKSRIEAALDYIKHQNYRRLFQEIGSEVKELLLTLQEICLQTLARNAPLTDFIVSLQEISGQISLVYELLINQRILEINTEKTFMDFDHSFLNSEAIIFMQIMKLAGLNDNLGGRLYQLILSLLAAVFRPITCTLNKIVFQQTIEISNRDETYLRYYFDKLKSLLEFLGKRIDLIKNQSNELYLICKEKLDIKLVTNIHDLQQYNHDWRKLFKDKKKKIDDIREKNNKKEKEERQKIHDAKVQEIYALKLKLWNNINERKKQKSKMYEEALREAQKLKQEIMEREQKRRLNYLIEKQEEKGYLLQAELNEKRRIIKQKENLLEEAEKLSVKVFEEVLKKSEEQRREKEQNKEKLIQREEVQAKDQDEGKNENLIHKEISNKMEKSLSVENEKEKIPSENSQIDRDSASNPKSRIKKMNSITLQSFELQSLEINNQNSSQSDDLSDSKSQISIHKVQNQLEEEQLHVNTNTVLSICVDNIIYQQMQITYYAMSCLVYNRYKITNIIDFMKKIFLGESGDVLSQFLDLSVDNDSGINLHYFRECQLFDKCEESIRILKPEFYSMKAEQKVQHGIYSSRKINIFHENLQAHIGFQFAKLPVLLEPYLSYIHLSKYMQIFSSLLRMRHSSSIISKCLLTLNQHKKSIIMARDYIKTRTLNKLFVTRHMIESFINTYSTYLEYRVIEKEIKRFKTHLKSEQLNEELSSAHLIMLDNIIRVGLIDNPFNDISKLLRELLCKIREFKNIVDLFCGDDLPSYMREGVQEQIDVMRSLFKDKQRFIESLFYHQ